MESTISVNAAPTDMTTPERPTRPVEPNAPARPPSVRWIENPMLNSETNADEIREETTEETQPQTHEEPYDGEYPEDHYDEPSDEEDYDLCPGCGGYTHCRCHDDDDYNDYNDYDDRHYDNDDEWIHYCGDRDCNGDCGLLACGCIDVCRGRCGRYDYY